MLESGPLRWVLIDKAKRHQSSWGNEPSPFSKRCWRASEYKVRSLAACLRFSRGKPFVRDEEIVQSSRPGQACFQSRIQHTCPLSKQITGCCMCQSGLVLLRAYPGPSSELALKMTG